MDLNLADILTDEQKAKLSERVAANLMAAADKVNYIELLTDDVAQFLESECFLERIAFDSIGDAITTKLVAAVKKLK